MDPRIVSSKEYRRFIVYSIKMKKYFQDKIYFSKSEYEKYLDCVTRYNQFLNEIGIRHVSKKYDYCYHNKTTWKYLDVVINGDYFIRAIYNPDFKGEK